MSKTKSYNRRSWLNPARHEDTGHIALDTCYTVSEDPKKVEFDGQLTIADCSRKVYINFDLYTWGNRKLDRGYKDRKKKLAVMRKYIDDLEQQLDDFYEQQKALEKKD